MRVVTQEQLKAGYLREYKPDEGPCTAVAIRCNYDVLRRASNGRDYIVDEPIDEVVCGCGGRGLCGVCPPPSLA